MQFNEALEQLLKRTADQCKLYNVPKDNLKTGTMEKRLSEAGKLCANVCGTSETPKTLLDEGSYWGFQDETGACRLLYSIFVYSIEKNKKTIPIKKDELENAISYKRPIMDRAADMHSLADRLLKETNKKRYKPHFVAG